MVKREKFKIKRKKGRVANISLVLFTLVLIITLITISYARWTTTLTIEGTAIAKEPELPVEPRDDTRRYPLVWLVELCVQRGLSYPWTP